MADSVKQPDLYQWQNTVNTKQMKMLDLIDLDWFGLDYIQGQKPPCLRGPTRIQVSLSKTSDWSSSVMCSSSCVSQYSELHLYRWAAMAAGRRWKALTNFYQACMTQGYPGDVAVLP